MDIQNILSTVMIWVTLGLIIGIVSKTVCDGILSAWGVETPFVKRLLVFLTNAFLVAEFGFYGFQNLYVNLAFLLLLVCSGAEGCHTIINNLKKLETTDTLDDIETDEQEAIEEYEDTEMVSEDE